MFRNNSSSTPSRHQKQAISNTKRQLDDLSTRQDDEDDDGKV